ncbi:MAG: hypothetical protein M0P30_07510 [Syntrophorhabdaceae bacterium]|nr:hypothetical protein [Syntrophorhabdaceae bacterium]HOC45046.1 hypothetical protein [Syntrophorhabdaceae bacterium]
MCCRCGRTGIAEGNCILDGTPTLVELQRKAAQWAKAKEIAKGSEMDGYPCDGCLVRDVCDSTLPLCGQAAGIVDALEGGS